MDLWFVGRVPIGHYSYNFPKEFKTESAKGAKVRSPFLCDLKIQSVRVMGR